MGGPIGAHCGGVFIGDRPADIVVAADIGGITGVGQSIREMCRQNMRHHRGIAGGQCAPKLHHQRVVIGQIACPPIMFAAPQIGQHFLRADNGLGKMDHGGGGDARTRAQGLQHHMHLGLGLAARAHAFPQEGHRIKPQHIDAGIGQMQHGFGDFQKHLRVGPVQIPLMFVKGGPDPFADVGVEVKLPGALSGNTSTSVAS